MLHAQSSEDYTPKFNQVGQATFTKFIFWDVFDAKLFLADGYSTADYENANIPVKLSLIYQLDISNQALIDAANDILVDLYSDPWFETYNAELARLNATYKSVREGDKYSIIYIPGSGMSLHLNAVEQVTIPNDQFAQDYLKIWLGNHPETEELSDQLLGK